MSRKLHLAVPLLAAFVLACAVNSAMAVPADPAGREVVQPDGKKFTLRLRGDEFFSWTETVDGYAIVMDTDGFWKYAQPAAGRIEFVAIPAARVGTADPARLGLVKHAMPDAKLLHEFIERRRRELMGEPEELPIPNDVTSTNAK